MSTNWITFKVKGLKIVQPLFSASNFSHKYAMYILCLMLLSFSSGAQTTSTFIGVQFSHGFTKTVTSGDLLGKYGNYTSIGLIGSFPVSFGRLNGYLLRSSRQILAQYENGVWNNYASPIPEKGVNIHLNSLTIGLEGEIVDFPINRVSVHGGLMYDLASDPNGYGSYGGSDNQQNSERIFIRTDAFRSHFVTALTGVKWRFNLSGERRFQVGIRGNWSLGSVLYKGEALLLRNSTFPTDSLLYYTTEDYDNLIARNRSQVSGYRLLSSNIQLEIEFLFNSSDPLAFAKQYDTTKERNHLIYLETFGSGFLYSINYEYIFAAKRGNVFAQYFSVRSGFSWWPRGYRGFMSTRYMGFPVSLQYGLGIHDTYLNIGGFITPRIIYESYTDPPRTISGWLSTFGSVIAIRYIPRISPLFFQFSYTPYWVIPSKHTDPSDLHKVWHWGGFAIGVKL